MLQANGQQQQLINELSNKNAQLQQQLQTTEKAVARSEKELAVFHQLQEDSSRSFPVAVNMYRERSEQALPTAATLVSSSGTMTRTRRRTS